MKKTILLYGLILALLVMLLRFLEYRFFLRELAIEVYISIIAVFFTGLGIWIALKLVNRRAGVTAQEFEHFEINKKNIESHKISDRELEVLQLLAQGYSNQEIADELFVSLNTVKTHISNLYSKLHVSRRTAAIKRSRELRLIP